VSFKPAYFGFGVLLALSPFALILLPASGVEKHQTLTGALLGIAIAWWLKTLLQLRRTRSASSPSSSRSTNISQPPRNLELFLYLIVPQSDWDPLIGDLEERYRKLVKRLGKSRADVWYMKQVLTSICPFLLAGMQRMHSSVVVGVVGFVLRFFGVGSVAGELKRAVAKK